MSFHFYKNIKNMDKNINYSIYSSKKHRQYESNKVNNTATKHSLCPGNGVFAHEKCIIFVIFYQCSKFVIFNNKNTTFKKAQKYKNKNIKKHVF